MSRHEGLPRFKRDTPNSGRRIFKPFDPNKMVATESRTYQAAKVGDHVWTCNECGRPRLYGHGWKITPNPTEALLICFGTHSQHPNQHFMHTFMEIYREEKVWTHTSKMNARLQ